MDRFPTPHAHPLRKAARKLLPLTLSISLCLAPQHGITSTAFAETTGTASPSITIFYGTGETVAGEWREDTLTIDGEPAYCVEVDMEFESGANVSACDPVASGIWSQEICTKLALIDQFVRSGSYISTNKGSGDGHKVTDPHEQYAVAQCYIWKFLNDAGYAQSSHGWFGASTEDGLDLTGSDTDKQIWDYVAANIGIWKGNARYFDCGNSQDLACSFSLEPVKGCIALEKRSSNEGISEKGSLYSLGGAEYGIYGDSECSDESLIDTITTNDLGSGRSQAIPAGSYFVKENKASAGYAIDETRYQVEVSAGEETLVNPREGFVLEDPVAGSISIQKQSSHPGISDGNDCYSLEGALYGVYADEECNDLIAKMMTDESGFAQADEIPLGTCFVREISAPAGFSVNGAVYRTVVEAGQVASVNGGTVCDSPKYAKPEILLEKRDSDLPEESGKPQGGASLANAEFEASFYAGDFETAEEAEESGEAVRTWVLKSDSDGRVPFDEDHLVSGDALFITDEGDPCIPLGTLVIKEITPPEGYLANEASFCIRIPDDGSSGAIVEEFIAPIVKDQVKRGDFEFIKVSGAEGNPLAGIPFAITCQATGETHVIVTDAEGRASTSSEFARHGQDTNGNDFLLDDGGAADRDPESGEGDDAPEAEGDGETPNPDDDPNPDDGQEEPLPPSENEGQPEQDPEVPPVTAPPVDDDDSTDTNDKGEEFEVARWGIALASEGESDENPSTEGDAASENKKLEPTGIWFGAHGNQEGGSPDEEKGALPYGSYLIEELPCQANEGLQLISASVVISEDGQTVDLGFIDDPKAVISTYASDEADGDKTLPSSDSVRIVDTVSYANLIPGEAYRLTGKIVDAESGDPLKGKDGSEISGSADFTPKEATGSAKVAFELSTEGMEGSKLVVFEALSCNGRVLALHEDPESKEQTIAIAEPAIGTQAKGSDGEGQTINTSGMTCITDTVSYTALTPGCEYRIQGRLIDARTGGEAKIEGEPITASATFTPEQASGSVEVRFEFDASLLQDITSLVAFEKLFAQDKLVAQHEDVNDPGQTIDLAKPAIQTCLTDEETGTQITQGKQSTRLVDTVSYSNLTPGVEYALSGTLMDKDSGEAALDGNGSPIESNCTFTPESPHGTTQVEFQFDASDLDGTTLVAFETLSRNGKTVAEHKEMESQAQSVTVATVGIKTHATDASDSDQIVSEGHQATIIDTVDVANATPGRTYTLAGILMDKSTGLPLLQKPAQGAQTTEGSSGEDLESFWLALTSATGLKNDGKAEDLEAPQAVNRNAIEEVLGNSPGLSNRIVVSQKEITPDSGSFSTDMEFAFSTQGIPGEAVVFEALIDKETGAVVATHADLNDQAQTIEIEPAKTQPAASTSRAVSTLPGKAYDKTGNLIARYAWVIALLAATGCASGYVALSRRKRTKRRMGIRC